MLTKVRHAEFLRVDSLPSISPIQRCTIAMPPDPLDPLFERWREKTPTLPRSVTGEVWSRIERAEAMSPLANALARIELAFSRPAFAAAFVAACVLLGLFLAETRLSDAYARRSAELERSYLHLLDPRVEPARASVMPTAHHQQP
jgi:hypothetical protein